MLRVRQARLAGESAATVGDTAAGPGEGMGIKSPYDRGGDER